MTIGVPREIKNNEHRVVMVPAGVRTLVERGHRVLVEKSAGEGSGIPDEEYRLTGAEVMESAGEAEMVIKVKEPIHAEWPLLNEGQILFTYLHLAPAMELTKTLLEKADFCYLRFW